MKRSLRPFIYRIAGYGALAIGILGLVRPGNANWNANW